MIHYAKYPKDNASACGLYRYGIFVNGSWRDHSTHYLLKLTRNKNRVECKRCRKTWKFRGLK